MGKFVWVLRPGNIKGHIRAIAVTLFRCLKVYSLIQVRMRCAIWPRPSTSTGSQTEWPTSSGRSTSQTRYGLIVSYWCVCVCVYGEFAPLYSCLRTLRKRYRSQNCDNGGTTSGLVRCTSQLWDKRGEGVEVPTCRNVPSWRLYSAASLGHQVAGTLTCYPIQSHYPDTGPISLCRILIMPSTGLGSDKYQF